MVTSRVQMCSLECMDRVGLRAVQSDSVHDVRLLAS